MALYINASERLIQKSHLWIGQGDSKIAFCGLESHRWESDYKRYKWVPIRKVRGNPPVTCRSCLDRLAGRPIAPNVKEGPPEVGPLEVELET